MAPFIESVNQIDGLTAKVVQDGAGRDIYRANVHVSGNHTAKEVIAELKESPAVYTREYQANNGVIEFDIRSVDAKEMALIAARLREIMN